MEKVFYRIKSEVLECNLEERDWKTAEDYEKEAMRQYNSTDHVPKILATFATEDDAMQYWHDNHLEVGDRLYCPGSSYWEFVVKKCCDSAEIYVLERVNVDGYNNEYQHEELLRTWPVFVDRLFNQICDVTHALLDGAAKPWCKTVKIIGKRLSNNDSHHVALGGKLLIVAGRKSYVLTKAALSEAM